MRKLSSVLLLAISSLLFTTAIAAMGTEGEPTQADQNPPTQVAPPADQKPIEQAPENQNPFDIKPSGQNPDNQQPCDPSVPGQENCIPQPPSPSPQPPTQPQQ